MANGEKEQRSLSAIRRSAATCLGRDGNRLLMVEALILCLLCVAMYLALTYVFSALMTVASVLGYDGTVFVLLWVFLILLSTLFLTVPFLSGLLRLSDRIWRGEEAVLGDLFWYFGDRARFRRAVMAARPTVYILLVAIAAILITDIVLTELLPLGIVTWWVYAALVVFWVTAAVLLLLREGMCLYPRLIPVEPLDREALRARMRGTMGMGLRYFLCFLPRVLLGTLTLGVLLLTHVIPEMLLTWSALGAERDQ